MGGGKDWDKGERGKRRWRRDGLCGLIRRSCVKFGNWEDYGRKLVDE